MALQFDYIIILDIVSDYNQISLDDLKMDDPYSVLAKKRSIAYVDARDFASKLRSKVDFIVYLDKHCKCINSYSLTIL